MNALASNLVLYSLQIACVVAIAFVGARFFRVRLARVRLAYWRLVVAACLVLPVLSQVAPETDRAVHPRTVSQMGLSIGSAHGSPAGTLAWLIPLVAIAGATVRIAWLAVGILRLRRLRGVGSLEPFEPDVRAAVAAVAPRAEFRWDENIAEPVTFGWWRPVVLLPRRLLALSPEIRRAVVLHETWHVARHDWLWLVLERAVQSLFWFHPAMWWAVDHIQLAREQVVDALVVKTTGSRHAYLRAMVAFADVVPAASLAAPFLRRRHLTQRVQAIATAAQPSARHSIVAAAVLIVITGSSALWASRALPFQPPDSSEVYEAGNGVTLPVVVNEVRPDYTDEAKAERIEGKVLLSCVVATDGRPTRITVVNSLDSVHGLDKAAVGALERWRFKPGTKEGKPVAVRVHIEMTFTLK
jgi:bla regulator protein blaR1